MIIWYLNMPLWLLHLLLHRGQRHKQDTFKRLLSDSDISSVPTITVNMNVCYSLLACSAVRLPWLLAPINPAHQTVPGCLLSENSFWNDLSIQPLFESLLIVPYPYLSLDSSIMCPPLTLGSGRICFKNMNLQEGRGGIKERTRKFLLTSC